MYGAESKANKNRTAGVPVFVPVMDVLFGV